MTFSAAPLSVDGAEISSALIRSGTYAAMSGGEGIVEAADLKVSQLTVPGSGILIAAGNAIVTNRYQTTPNQSYVVTNPGAHQVLSASMPAVQPTAKSYLVLVTIGDPEFSQVGHPWMTSEELDPEEAAAYQYVRVWFLEVAAGTTSFVGLGLNYPAYAIARLDIPANTSTITNAMITDLRGMARARATEVQFNAVSGNGALVAAANTYMAFVAQHSLAIPSWATKAKVFAYLESLYMMGGSAAYGDFRTNILNAGATPITTFDETAPGASTDGTRYGYNMGGDIAIPSAVRGTTQTVQIEGRVYNAAWQNKMKADNRTTSFVRVRFEESPV